MMPDLPIAVFALEAEMRIEELDPRVTEAMLYPWNHSPLNVREDQASLDRFVELMEDPDA